MPRVHLAALALLLLAPRAAAAQEAAPERANAIYVEAFGNAVLFSVNYERTVLPWMGVRVGASQFPNIDPGEDPDMYLFPFLLHFRIGNGRAQPELGVGTLVVYRDTRAMVHPRRIEPFEVLPSLSFGVRARHPGSPLILRSGITPLYFEDGFRLSFGASFGVMF
jgi:hypothetical protein